MRILAIILLTGLAMGCGTKLVPVVTEVQVPIEIKAAPPTELFVPIQTIVPMFIEPTDTTASSALSVEDERLLRALINDLITRIQAWEAWAKTQVGE